jgi:hypothetical protein
MGDVRRCAAELMSYIERVDSDAAVSARLQGIRLECVTRRLLSDWVINTHATVRPRR